ncbi:hypothetical protein PHLCEN_2v9160 [Hermanssonia centrifuga]|uniref:Uncharacterized protein n=1 Tax=Hermanssonia centrifuga TaxID=98765 RepID=A0A2R6NRN2_9APHY|nr:hypothetical protein PHLCEN_2v9160 [Hermanssonia centrifuga]
MPDPLVQALLSESYSTLCTHSRRVYDLAFSESHPAPPVVPHKTGFAFSSIISIPRFWTHKAGIPESLAVQERDKRFALLRWGFFGTAFVALATHFYFAGVVGFYKTLLGNVLVRVQLERLAANGALEGEDELEDLEDERDEEEAELDLEEEL